MYSGMVDIILPITNYVIVIVVIIIKVVTGEASTIKLALLHLVTCAGFRKLS